MRKVAFKVFVDTNGVKWARPIDLKGMFSIGRSTIYALLKEMGSIAKYRKSFLDLGHRLKLVKVADFENFLYERSRKKMYLRR